LGYFGLTPKNEIVPSQKMGQTFLLDPYHCRLADADVIHYRRKRFMLLCCSQYSDGAKLGLVAISAQHNRSLNRKLMASHEATGLLAKEI
jgi:hypothetical protein